MANQKETSTVVGRAKVNFTSADGNQIRGENFYINTPLNDASEGSEAYKIFVRHERLVSLGYIPNVGDEVVINFDRRGRLTSFVKVDDDELI